MIFIWLIRLIFIGNSLYLFWMQNFSKAYLLIGSLALTFLPQLYSRFVKIKIPLGIVLFYEIFIFGCQWLGTYLRWYDSLPWWDVLLHFSSGLLLGYIGLILLVSLDKSQLLFEAKKTALISCFTLAIAIMGAALWEIFEYSSDQLLGSFTQLGSLQDTMEDLIVGTIGGVLFSGYTYWVLVKDKKSSIQTFLKMNKKKEE